MSKFLSLNNSILYGVAFISCPGIICNTKSAEHWRPWHHLRQNLSSIYKVPTGSFVVQSGSHLRYNLGKGLRRTAVFGSILKPSNLELVER